MPHLRTARDVVNLRQGRTDWYKIRNLSSGPEVLIYDEIGYFGVTAQDFIKDLDQVDGPLTLRLNTPGGEVFDGLTIYNALLNRGDVSISIDGLAASIGSVIAMAAAPGQLTIAKTASMMIHDGFSMCVGNAADMRELADLLDEQSDIIAGVYADRTGQSASYWRDRMRSETWFAGQAAVDAGLADRVSGKAAPLNGSWDLSVFRNALILDADGNHATMSGTHTHAHSAYGSQGGDSMHSHEHSHDGDASHSHHSSQAAASDHSSTHIAAAAATTQPQTQPAQQPQPDGDAAADAATIAAEAALAAALAAVAKGGSAVKVYTEEGIATVSWVIDPASNTCPVCLGNKAASPIKTGTQFPSGDDEPPAHPNCRCELHPGTLDKPHSDLADQLIATLLAASVDNSDWDASKAWAAGAASDDPAKFYAGICAGKKSGDPSNQASWALPYKYAPSSPPNSAGVRNALSRLPQTDGLSNKAEAQSLLERLMKQINPDYGADASDLADPHLLYALLASGLEGGRK